MIDKKAGETLGAEVDYTCYKMKFQVSFIAFVGNRITCCKVEEFTLDTWSICNFSWKILVGFLSSLFKQFLSLFFVICFTSVLA